MFAGHGIAVPPELKDIGRRIPDYVWKLNGLEKGKAGLRMLLTLVDNGKRNG
jgi:hypothetical protein